jgi:hypothetical protein
MARFRAQNAAQHVNSQAIGKQFPMPLPLRRASRDSLY